MPREVIQIDPDSSAEGEAMSILVSQIAYPETDAGGVRRRFRDAIYRLAILDRTKRDKAWRDRPQFVNVTWLMDDDREVESSFKAGLEKFDRHYLTAFYFLHPHIKAVATRKEAVARLPDGMIANATNAALQVGATVGVENEKTFYKNIWRPTKPVAHLAYALARGLKTFDYSPSAKSVFFDAFFDRLLISHVIWLAEEIRQGVARIGRPNIPDSVSLRFVTPLDTTLAGFGIDLHSPEDSVVKRVGKRAT
jgi:hypothetical protein